MAKSRIKRTQLTKFHHKKPLFVKSWFISIKTHQKSCLAYSLSAKKKLSTEFVN